MVPKQHEAVEEESHSLRCRRAAVRPRDTVMLIDVLRTLVLGSAFLMTAACGGSTADSEPAIAEDPSVTSDVPRQIGGGRSGKFPSRHPPEAMCRYLNRVCPLIPSISEEDQESCRWHWGRCPSPSRAAKQLYSQDIYLYAQCELLLATCGSSTEQSCSRCRAYNFIFDRARELRVVAEDRFSIVNYKLITTASGPYQVELTIASKSEEPLSDLAVEVPLSEERDSPREWEYVRFDVIRREGNEPLAPYGIRTMRVDTERKWRSIEQPVPFVVEGTLQKPPTVAQLEEAKRRRTLGLR